MPMPDVFKTDIFGLVSLTQSINKLPYVPSRVGELGLFKRQGVTTTYIDLEEKSGVLSLIGTKARGGPANLAKTYGRTMRTLKCLHIPLEDAVLADEVQGVRAFGSENATEGIAQRINDKLGAMKQDHMVTLEWLELNALKGIVLDADGTSELYDLFKLYGLAAPTIDFNLDVTTTIIRQRCLDTKRIVEDALGAAVYGHVHAFCGKTWFDALIDHADVRKAYDAAQATNEYRDDPRKGFTFADIVWEEYRGSVGGVQFVGDSECQFFPVGVPDLFNTYYAPADFIETVNTIGLALYAKQTPMEFDRGVKLHTQQNPLPICNRPGVLLKGILTSSSV